jgi:hypothetical protein
MVGVSKRREFTMFFRFPEKQDLRRGYTLQGSLSCRIPGESRRKIYPISGVEFIGIAEKKETIINPFDTACTFSRKVKELLTFLRPAVSRQDRL